MPVFYEDERFRYSIEGWFTKQHVVYDKAARKKAVASADEVQKLGDVFMALRGIAAARPIDHRRGELHVFKAFCVTVARADDGVSQLFISHDAATAAMIFGTM